MKLKYLGDTLDFYKRWFLAEFFPDKQLAAIPMLTEQWSSSDLAAYSALLKVKVIQTDVVPNQRGPKRTDYLSIGKKEEFLDQDVFFDPDTGLRTKESLPRGRKFDEYIFAYELQDLLPADSRRVAVVYDHSISRDDPVESAKQKLQPLCEMAMFSFAYCAQAAMVVVSRSKDRVIQLHQKAAGLAHLPKDRLFCN